MTFRRFATLALLICSCTTIGFGQWTPGGPYATGIGGYDLSTATDQVIAFDYYSLGKADHLIC